MDKDMILNTLKKGDGVSMNSNVIVYCRNIDLIDQLPKSPIDTDLVFMEGSIDSAVIKATVNKRGASIIFDDWSIEVLVDKSTKAIYEVDYAEEVLLIYIPNEVLQQVGVHELAVKLTEKSTGRVVVSGVSTFRVKKVFD